MVGFVSWPWLDSSFESPFSACLAQKLNSHLYACLQLATYGAFYFAPLAAYDLIVPLDALRLDSVTIAAKAAMSLPVLIGAFVWATIGLITTVRQLKASDAAQLWLYRCSAGAT